MKGKILKNGVYAIAIIIIAIVGFSIYKGSAETLSPKENGKPIATIETMDSEGQAFKEEIYKVPNRVITTNQTSTELLIQLGLEDKIVGTAYKDNAVLPDLKEKFEKLKVLSAKYPTKEEALFENPDFLFGWSTAFKEKSMGTIQSWNDRGVNVYVQKNTISKNRPYTVENVFDDITTIGKVFNIEDRANNYVESLKAKLNTIKKETSTVKNKKRVLILEAQQNGSYRAYATTDLVGNMIELAGGIDPISKPGNISAEDIIKYNPDAVFLVVFGDKDEENVKNTFLNDPKLKTVTAIKDKNVNLLPLADIWAGGVRTVPTIERMYQELYKNKESN